VVHVMKGAAKGAAARAAGTGSACVAREGAGAAGRGPPWGLPAAPPSPFAALRRLVSSAGGSCEASSSVCAAGELHAREQGGAGDGRALPTGCAAAAARAQPLHGRERARRDASSRRRTRFCASMPSVRTVATIAVWAGVRAQPGRQSRSRRRRAQQTHRQVCPAPKTGASLRRRAPLFAPATTRAVPRWIQFLGQGAGSAALTGRHPPAYCWHGWSCAHEQQRRAAARGHSRCAACNLSGVLCLIRRGSGEHV
jgi:hypothetical protein